MRNKNFELVRRKDMVLPAFSLLKSKQKVIKSRKGIFFQMYYLLYILLFTTMINLK